MQISMWWRWWKRRGGAEPERPAPKLPAPEREQIFLDPEQAERPVDLGGELETGAQRGPLVEALARQLHAEADRTRDEATRKLIRTLERTAVKDGIELPPMPETALRLHRMIDSIDCDLRKLGAEIELDPALTTKLVGIANSPFYACMEPVHGVADALVRVGLRETRNIILAITMHSRVFRAPGFEREIRDLWHHGLAAAMAGQILAAESGFDPDLGFLAGLTHDVGRAVILAHAGRVYRVSRAKADLPRAALVPVVDAFHAPFSGLVAASWRLVPEVVTALSFHHQPWDAPEPGRRLAHLVRAADCMAKVLLAPDDAHSLAEALEQLGVDEAQTDTLLEEARERYESVAKLF